MSHLKNITRDIEPQIPILYAVKTFLDLISKDNFLTYGSGLKRLYTLSKGLDTYNDIDIEAATKKAETMEILPYSLHGFMVASILKNCSLYGKILEDLINTRLQMIGTGEVQNPEPQIKYNPSRARRHFYAPPETLVRRLIKALGDDFGYESNYGQFVATRLKDVAVDFLMTLNRMQGSEGYISPQPTSFGALSTCVRDLVAVMDNEALYIHKESDYRGRGRSALQILWVIAKLLMGDLSTKPLPADVNEINLKNNVHISDGTLASIPFPTRATMSVFYEDEVCGLSMKGRFYLSAVSAAEFYQQNAVVER